MYFLTRDEIIVVLKQLGLDGRSELEEYFRDYVSYSDSLRYRTMSGRSVPRERRLHKRIIVGLEAEIISGESRLKGVIENVSENGIHMITLPRQTDHSLPVVSTLNLKIQPISGKTLDLRCAVKWSYKTKPHGLTSAIGMEIIDPPWTASDLFV